MSLTQALGPAFRFAWETFAARWGRLVGIYAIICGVVFVPIFVLWAAMVIHLTRWGMFEADPRLGSPAPEAPPAWLFVGFGVVFVTMLLLGLFGWVWTARLGLDATAGRELNLRRFFTLRGTGKVLGATVLLSLATAVGCLLCYVPGLAIAVLTMFVVPLMLDRGMGFGEAVAASGRLVRENLGGCLLWGIVGGGLITVSELTVIGILVALPIAAILNGCLYREVVSRGART
ncbi:hypothetical protein [Cellulomonas sp. NPDC089187]|uniref:hypothetical protein n=1 Tax=Cellulomonas sp. NPDC089187 TaxID=3154970 RepID=UPI003422375B